MAKTDHLRSQHTEMVELVKDISSKLNADYCKNNAPEMTKKMNLLVGRLKIHLSSEDKVLYPPLLAHKDFKVKSTAEAFMKEMGGIASVVESHYTKWMLPTSLQKDPEGFVKETKGLFDALAKRIEKEHKDLYPLLDAA